MLGEILIILKDVLFFVAYVSNNQSFPQPLSAQEEAEYIELWEKGDYQAKLKLIEHNLRLVAHIAKKYTNTGHDMDDLISIGTVGLIKAVNTYDRSRQKPLAAYSAKCIENEILMLLRANKKRRNDVSLQDPIGTDSEGNELTLSDILGNEDISLDRVLMRMQGMHLPQEMTKHLTSRERLVLKLRYGLWGGSCLTQREVAGKLGISRSYVSRLEKHAIEQLVRVFTDQNKEMGD